jgi:hypothetical protein
MAENKDWTGNNASIWKTLGASNHTDKERQKEDFYATDRIAIDKLAKAFVIPHNVYEPCCGAGDLSKRLEQLGHNVVSTDLVDRGYGEGGVDFLLVNEMPFDGMDCCILTNPPFKYATEMVEHALQILPYGCPCIFLMKTTALEGKSRYERLYRSGYLQAIYQFTERLLFAKNVDFEGMIKGGGIAVAYAFFVFTAKRCDAPLIHWI